MSIIEINEMSIEERLELMELLWNSLDATNVPVPDWHRKILDERAKRPAKFSSLDEVKQRLHTQLDDH
jgi:putative addiction module component (TIGR02574 family)